MTQRPQSHQWRATVDRRGFPWNRRTPRWELDNLWLRVEKDKRHCDPIRIGDVSRGQRRFPDWMMAYTVHSDVSVIREIP